MRLIDADALTEEIEKNMENGFPANEYLSLYAISCIAHAPTVDVLEQIRTEIQHLADLEVLNMKTVLQIIDKYRSDV